VDIFAWAFQSFEAIETLKKEHFDMLILDYIMSPIHGDEVVAKIREFNKDIYILLLTGHKTWLLLLKPSRLLISRDIAKRETSLTSFFFN